MTSLKVFAIPYTDASTPGTLVSVGVFVDNVYNTTLSYGGTVGVKASATLTLDGSAHAVDLEEQAALTDIQGAFSLQTAAAPLIRVVLFGDSITRGVGSSVFSKGYSGTLRHSLMALGSGYGLTNAGQSGRTMFGSSGSPTRTAINTRCDGTSKNIVVIPLMINDYLNNVTIANYTSTATTLVAGLITLNAAVKILLVPSPNRASEGANGAGATLPDYRTAMSGVATAHAANCTYVSAFATLYPDTSSTYSADGTHPTDAGHALWASALQTAILAA